MFHHLTNQLTHSVTNLIKQHHSSDVYGCFVSHEVSLLSSNLQVHYRKHASQALVANMNHPQYIAQSHELFSNSLNIIICFLLQLTSCFFFPGFTLVFSMQFSSLTLTTCRVQHRLLDFTAVMSANVHELCTTVYSLHIKRNERLRR